MGCGGDNGVWKLGRTTQTYRMETQNQTGHMPPCFTFSSGSNRVYGGSQRVGKTFWHCLKGVTVLVHCTRRQILTLLPLLPPRPRETAALYFLSKQIFIHNKDSVLIFKNAHVFVCWFYFCENPKTMNLLYTRLPSTIKDSRTLKRNIYFNKYLSQNIIK